MISTGSSNAVTTQWHCCTNRQSRSNGEPGGSKFVNNRQLISQLLSPIQIILPAPIISIPSTDKISQIRLYKPVPHAFGALETWIRRRWNVLCMVEALFGNWLHPEKRSRWLKLWIVPGNHQLHDTLRLSNSGKPQSWRNLQTLGAEQTGPRTPKRRKRHEESLWPWQGIGESRSHSSKLVQQNWPGLGSPTYGVHVGLYKNVA